VGLLTFAGADDAKTAADVTADNPLPIYVIGEAIEAIEAMRMALQALTRTMGQMQPDTAARMRVVLDAVTSTVTLPTLANQSQVGGLSPTEQIPSLMRLGADSLRRNISVT